MCPEIFTSHQHLWFSKNAFHLNFFLCLHCLVKDTKQIRQEEVAELLIPKMLSNMQHQAWSWQSWVTSKISNLQQRLDFEGIMSHQTDYERDIYSFGGRRSYPLAGLWGRICDRNPALLTEKRVTTGKGWLVTFPFQVHWVCDLLWLPSFILPGAMARMFCYQQKCIKGIKWIWGHKWVT